MKKFPTEGFVPYSNRTHVGALLRTPFQHSQTQMVCDGVPVVCLQIIQNRVQICSFSVPGFLFLRPRAAHPRPAAVALRGADGRQPLPLGGPAAVPLRPPARAPCRPRGRRGGWRRGSHEHSAGSAPGLFLGRILGKHHRGA